MSSGLPGGSDFYTSRRNGVGSASIGQNPLQYRSQLGGIHLDQAFTTIPRRNDMLLKRSLGEFESHHQIQQEQGIEFYLRSVKHRANHQYSSPMSLISPAGFSSTISPESPFSGRYGSPLLQQQFRSSTPAISLNNHTQIPFYNPTFSNNLSYSDVYLNNPLAVQESEPDSEKKMRNRLQELEKQLLDDDDNGEEEGEAISGITNSEWSETIQSLLSPTQKPLSPSSTTSSSSSSSSSASPLQSLAEVAVLISEGNTDAAVSTLARLKQISNRGGDPEQRITSYMVSALESRLKISTENSLNTTELFSGEHLMATQMLYEISPCFKLGFMATNLSILEATRDHPTKTVHIVDFDIGQGSQYFSLIHALAERNSGKKPTGVKITTVGDPYNNNEEDGLRLIGEELRKLAERVGISLKFNVVNSNVFNLNREELGCDSDEVLAVNFVFRLYKMADESVSTENPRDSLLRLVKSLNPLMVTLVEQEINTNTAPFVARVTETWSYYRALFDLLDSTMTRDAAERVRVEECLGRKLVNSVACEGSERVERCEVFGKWRARMGMAGFKPKPLSQHVGDSLRSRLTMGNQNNPGFTIKEEAGGICLGWKGRVLTVASTWC